MHLCILQAGLWFSVFMHLTSQRGWPHKIFVGNVWAEKIVQ